MGPSFIPCTKSSGTMWVAHMGPACRPTMAPIGPHMQLFIGIYQTNCALSRTRKHTQNKPDKIVFFQTARHSSFGKKNYFVMHVFSTYLDHNLSDIYIGNIRFIHRTNCTLSRTKKHAQNKSDISDLYIGQIVL